jgi:hypothetical protein
MAMTVIPHRSLLTNEKMTNSIIRPGPRETAKQICDEIQRAIRDTGNVDLSGERDSDAVDAGEQMVREENIISAAGERSRAGYLEQIRHSIKKHLWV